MDEEINFCDNAPSWRWETIRSFVEENRIPSRRSGDDEFRSGYSYLKRWKSSTMSGLPQLRRDYPILYKAHVLFCNQQSEKWMIEAGLLTDVKAEDISDYVAQPVEVIKEYEKYFFDVKPNLASRGYILNQVIMPSVGRGMADRDFDFVFKTLAYCAGWDIFIDFIDHQNASAATANFLTRNFRDSLLKLGWLATKRVNLNNYNAIEVIDRCLQLMAIEKEHGQEVAKDSATAMMHDLLTHCKMAILPTDVNIAACEERVVEMISGKKLLKYGDPIPLQG